MKYTNVLYYLIWILSVDHTNDTLYIYW